MMRDVDQDACEREMLRDYPPMPSHTDAAPRVALSRTPAAYPPMPPTVEPLVDTKWTDLNRSEWIAIAVTGVACVLGVVSRWVR